MTGYRFIPYFWVDLMAGLFLFGFTFLIYCLWYRLGPARMLIALTVVIIGGMFLYYGGVLTSVYVDMVTPTCMLSPRTAVLTAVETLRWGPTLNHPTTSQGILSFSSSAHSKIRRT